MAKETIRYSPFAFVPVLFQLLHIDADGAAAGQPDLPCGLVGDTEFERLRLAALDHVERFGHHRALDAAARNAAEEIALIVDHQIRTHRPRRRAPGLDHGCERDPASLRPPILRRSQDVFIAREHVLSPSPRPHPRGLPGGHHSPSTRRWIARAPPAMTITPPCPTRPLDRRRGPPRQRARAPDPPWIADCGSAAIRQHAAIWSGCPWPWPRNPRSAAAD